MSKITEVGQSFDFNQDDEIRTQTNSDDIRVEIPDHLKQMFEQGCQNLSKEQTAKFKNFIFQHQDNFAKPGEVGQTNFGSHKIKLKDETPIKDASRRIPIFKRDEEVKKSMVCSDSSG